MTQISRRNLISSLGVALAARSQEATSAGKPKIGCTSWAFHVFSPGQDPEPAIEVIGELGFDTIELIILAKEDLTGFWTDGRISRIRSKIEAYGLGISQVAMFQPVVEGLTSPDADERGRNLDAFESGCSIVNRLGAPMVNIVAPWPRQLKGPQSYLPRYYDIPDAKQGDKFHIDIAPGFDWEATWESYVEVTKACLERAKSHGLKFSIENHTHTMIPDTSSFLRLWEAVRDPDLGMNLDIGWIALQREYPPVAIHKVRRQLLHVHARDIDGMMRGFPHIGEGVMDFEAVSEALRQIGYAGAISLEQDKHPGHMKVTCQAYLETMRELLG